MFAHYLKLFLRHLWKNKSFSLINITGLSIGLTCCFLISMYVKHELSYDQFQQKGERMVRMIMEYNIGGNINRGNYTSTKVGPAFRKNFPEVEEFVRMAPYKKIVRNGERLFIEDRFVYTDSTFFKLFSFSLLEGDRKTALSGPNKVVLTQSAAKKYFGDQSPVGKTIKVSSAGTDYMVTGVIEDCPDNSQVKFDFLASFCSLGVTQEETYWNANYTTYLLLKDEASIAPLQEKTAAFMKKEMKDVVTGQDYLTFILEPFMSIHLHSGFSGFEVNGSITYVYIVSAVALMILLIACFTFINLSTAKSVERAREIGIRKVNGAFRPQIFWQFIGESALIVSMAALLSLVAASLLLPSFNSLMGRSLHMGNMLTAPFIAYCFSVVFLVSLFAGSYPALVLSSFQPVKVLKGLFRHSDAGLTVRKALFVFQFVVSVFMVICAAIVQKQLQFIQGKNIGFDREHVVVLPYDQKVHENYTAFRTALKQNSGVLSVARGDFDPCRITGGYSMQKPEMLPDKSFGVFAGAVDEEYLDACGIGLSAGKNIMARDVKDASQEDTSRKAYFHFLLNEEAAKQMGWTAEEAVGKKMYLDLSRPGEVAGVMKNFHFSSLHEPIKPLVLFPGDFGNKILVKLSGASIGDALPYLEKTWKSLIPHRPFEYKFLDENYQAMYQAEIKLGKAINVFTLLAILLACMGLFGLSSYNIQQRTKEIGILRVLGAPVSSIVLKLSRNFLLLVVIAILISLPLSWIIMNKWLQDFSYRTEVSPWIMIMAAVFSLLLAFATIGVKAFRAASANPVKNLRTE